ncbi:Gfo/Idh/MocA family protein [Limisalsivibrio acetivorans]|uniref:Gfo/Idh/MocA family protein n=1 Tax=Limisalsivibrio acetivorans TaxID=1304888 RepID=UPI0003B305DE|nr:Gfo/Idh/MocA family oxidoreductase [Limisalsivibrio acetivorans]
MLNVGIIGLGKMGKYHLNIYDELTNANMAGMCDASEEVLGELSKRYPYKTYTDYRELLPHVDAVTIAAPTVHHYDIAKECLEAGVHVLVEKPITTDLAQAEELFNIAEKRGLVLHIGHVERFNGAVQELRKIATDPYLIESRRVGPYNPNFAGDSIVLDLMIHDIDIIVNMVNSDVTELQASGYSVHSKLPDYASVHLHFANNTTAHILVSRVTQKKDRTMSISQKDSFISLDYTSQDINIYRNIQSTQIMGNKELRYKNEYVLERLFVYKDNPLKQEIKHFLDCVSGQEECRVVTVEHELKSLKIALKIDEILMKDKGAIEVNL